MNETDGRTRRRVQVVKNSPAPARLYISAAGRHTYTLTLDTTGISLYIFFLRNVCVSDATTGLRNARRMMRRKRGRPYKTWPPRNAHKCLLFFFPYFKILSGRACNAQDDQAKMPLFPFSYKNPRHTHTHTHTRHITKECLHSHSRTRAYLDRI